MKTKIISISQSLINMALRDHAALDSRFRDRLARAKVGRALYNSKTELFSIEIQNPEFELESLDNRFPQELTLK